MAYSRLGAKVEVSLENLRNTLRGVSFVTASAGNHDVSMSVGANLFGANAIVFSFKKRT